MAQYFQVQLRHEKDMFMETLHTTAVHAAANRQIQLYDKDRIHDKNDMLKHAITQMNHKNTLNERSQ